MIYDIKLNLWAKDDIEQVIDYIENELFAPNLAERFARGLYEKINQLKLNADVFAKSTYKDISKYDAVVRHVIYKGFAIVYSIRGNLVVVHRVIHGSLIRE